MKQTEQTEYTVYALDEYNCELRVDSDYTNKQQAIQRAKMFLKDTEIFHELYKVEVRNEKEEVIWDDFITK